MVDGDRLVVADFGLALKSSVSSTLLRGSDEILAPEIHNLDSYTGVKSDIFSLGVILFYLSFGTYPW